MVDYFSGNRFVKWLIYLSSILVILGCGFMNISVNPVALTVTQLSACEGPDQSGKPVGDSEVFAPETERIFACGYLDTDQPADIETRWYYEEQLVFQQPGRDIKGYFYSFVEPPRTGTFSKGAYKIEVLFGGTTLKSVDFRIE